MEGKILRPIPGTGYVVGELATFSEKSAEKYAEYLNDSNYFEKGSIEKLQERDEKVAAEKVELRRKEKEALAGKANAEEEAGRKVTDLFFQQQIEKRDAEEAAASAKKAQVEEDEPAPVKKEAKKEVKKD